MCRSFPGRIIEEQAPIELTNSSTLNYLKVSLLYKLCPAQFHPPLCSLGQLQSTARASSAPQQVLQKEMFILQLQLTPTCSRGPLTPCSGHFSQAEVDFLWSLKYWVTKCSSDLGKHHNPLQGFTRGLHPFPGSSAAPRAGPSPGAASQHTPCSFPAQTSARSPCGLPFSSCPADPPP